jgi:hypothetical protein
MILMRKKKQMIGERQRKMTTIGILTLQNLIYLKQPRKLVKQKKAMTMILG